MINVNGKGSSYVKLLAVMTALVMAFTALAIIPADISDADDGKVTTWDELKDAVESASYGATIVLANDIIDDSKDDAIEVEDNSITIDLAGFKIDRQRGTADGKDGRLFEISDHGLLFIRNGTLTGGHGDDGGCILLEDAGLVQLDDVIVTGNYSEDDGGAIWAANSQVNIFGGQVTNNSCKGDGGAIYIENCAFIQAEGVKFSSNKAGGDGGAVCMDEGCYVFSKCDIRENSANGNGGAIYIKELYEYENYRIIDQTNFTENNANKSGGAIYLKDGFLGIYASMFDNNWSDDNGGAIYAEDSGMDIQQGGGQDPIQSVFKGNQATNSGGAVMLYGGEYRLFDAVFENNYAHSTGGGVYINNDSVVMFNGATFTGNHVLNDGGAILVGGDDGNKVELKGKIVIKDNDASREGPNVFIRSDRKLICDELDEGSSIGVVLANGDGKFTKDFDKNNPGVDPAKIFFSDSQRYYVGSDGGEAKMYASGTSGDMSDYTIWIVVGVIAAIVVIAAAVYVLRSRKSNAA